MKKIVSVNEVIPNTKHGGGGVTAFSAIEGFLNNGFKVDVLVLKEKEKDNLEHKSALENLGAKVLFLDIKPILERQNFIKKLKFIFNPSFEELFPNVLISNIVNKKLNELTPDFVFTYHWEALASIYGIKDYVKISTVGDPIHLPSLFRQSLYSRLDHNMTLKRKILHKIVDKFIVKQQIKGMVQLLNSSHIRGAFAAHHAKELIEYGVDNCRYFHTPVPDTKSNIQIKNKKFKIVLMGILIGVASLSGIEIFINEIYPIIDKEIGKDNYEVHIVGGFFETMPKYLQDGLNKDNIILRGQISPPDNEFLSSDVLLVPTPIDLGIRVRIITAFSFGSLVVAHSANQKGIPELIHEKNGLIGNSGIELAEQIIKVYKNEVNIDEIRSESRKTYEKEFTPDSFYLQISKEIDSLS